jgi:hypothetical protein
MSTIFNELSSHHVERITDALVEALAFTHPELQPLGRALARASEKFFEAAFLASYGDDDEAAALLNLCRRYTIDALALIDSPRADSDIRPNFIEIEEEA